MKSHRNASPIAALALVSMLVLAGCKSNNQQAGNAPANSSTPQTSQYQQQPNGPSGSVTSGAPATSGSSQASSPASGSAPAQAYAPSSAAPSSAPAPAAAAPQAPPPPTSVDLPAGTSLTVRLDQDLGSKISSPGDNFTASIADDVIVNGQIVIARGARADGTVINAKALGKIKGGAVLSIRIDRVHTNWGSYPVETSTIDRAEKGKGKRTGAFAAGGGAFGALVGGLAGGGKGALIGALAGGGAGTAGSAFTGNKEIVLPAETELTFRLENPVHITEQQR